MSYMTSKFVVQVRRTMRRLGITPTLLEKKFGITREVGFRKKLMEAARPGDVVWEVGAAWGGISVGLAERVGADGVVVAFEPNERYVVQLLAKKERLPNLVVVPKALGNVKGLLSTDEAERPRVGGDSDQAYEKEISITTGDAAREEDDLPIPNVMKIDAEGYELEVLKGCERLLGDRSLRAVFIEVHFRILDETGREDVPAQIVSLLEDRGFRTKWVDTSHLMATRP